MKNLEIRQLLSKYRMRHYELADLLGISEFALSKMLRNELPEEKKKQIISVIEEWRKAV